MCVLIFFDNKWCISHKYGNKHNNSGFRRQPHLRLRATSWVGICRDGVLEADWLLCPWPWIQSPRPRTGSLAWCPWLWTWAQNYDRVWNIFIFWLWHLCRNIAPHANSGWQSAGFHIHWKKCLHSVMSALMEQVFGYSHTSGCLRGQIGPEWETRCWKILSNWNTTSTSKCLLYFR